MTKQRKLTNAEDYVTRHHIYLVIDPHGGPANSMPRDRAFDYARNTGCVVARLEVITDRREEAR